MSILKTQKTKQGLCEFKIDSVEKRTDIETEIGSLLVLKEKTLLTSIYASHSNLNKTIKDALTKIAQEEKVIAEIGAEKERIVRLELAKQTFLKLQELNDQRQAIYESLKEINDKSSKVLNDFIK